jgi:8-oxo-dGTP pyrophosphatase MutT (NUDIX family)
MDYKSKYLKYKSKYLNLKKQLGGGIKNACIALFYKNQIYLIQQTKDNKWNIPGGHIDRGENSFQAAFREFEEETGGFDLLRWTNSTKPRKDFEHYEYGHPHPHTKIWWYVSRENPEIVFNINRETKDAAWFDINNLPSNLRFPGSIGEIIAHVRSKGLLE